jgi:hypothetical protein
LNAKAAAKKPKKKQLAKLERDKLVQEQRGSMQQPDPFSRENVKKMGLRMGIPLAIGWAIALAFPGWIPKAIAGVATLIMAGIVGWIYRFTSKTKAVASIVRDADTAEKRKEALSKLDTDFKDGDVAATFAKAQLQLQEDPRAALATLETIDLKKVMAPMADETRSQRAMIHLMLGETDHARTLADQVDLSRHKEARTRATLAAIVGEAWARSGQAKKAVEMLENFDLNDDDFKELRPQLYRSLAFAYAWSNQTKKMKATLRKLKSINVQLLMGFITKKKNPQGVSPRGVHPALEKEAYGLVMKSGAVPRKMQFKRA